MITRIIVLAGLLLCLLLPLSGRASTVAEYCVRPEDWQMLALINDYRAEHGRGALQMSQTLGAAAEHHALDMAATGNHTHTLSDGTSWLQNIINHDYPYDIRSENIAWGFGGSPQAVFDAWKASDSHNSAMLYSVFGAIGIARRYSPSGYPNWVTTFGSRLDQNAVSCGSGATATVAPTSTPQATATPKPTATAMPTATATTIPTATATPRPRCNSCVGAVEGPLLE